MTKSTNSSATHNTTERATTLNRRYVRRPNAFVSSQPTEKILESTTVSPAIVNSSQIHAEALKRRQAIAAQMNRQSLAARKKSYSTQPPKTASRKISISPASAPNNVPAPEPTPRPSTPHARSLASAPTRVQASRPHTAESALHSVATMQSAEQSSKKSAKRAKKTLKDSHRGRRFILAFTASAACIALLGIIVKVNMPDLSVQVAALQTGIDAKYPSYIPNGFQLGGVSTEKDGSINMEFNGSAESAFIISEEKSSWDSNALLNNYVKGAWRDDYIVVREQGITIYISNSDAAWVNGGICYKLNSSAADTLTKKQIKNIVTSL